MSCEPPLSEFPPPTRFAAAQSLTAELLSALQGSLTETHQLNLGQL